VRSSEHTVLAVTAATEQGPKTLGWNLVVASSGGPMGPFGANALPEFYGNGTSLLDAEPT
jgi:hypothetical protein